MANTASQSELEDPLYNLRLAISSSQPPTLATSADPSSAGETVTDLSIATHISFNNGKTFELTIPTRFAPNDAPVSLRSIYFAWQNKDASHPEYIAAVTHLNEELPSGAGGSVQSLSFALRIELTAWLNGETESSESIAALDGAAAMTAAESSAKIASGKGGVPVVKNREGADARLLEIYDGERKMGDHNTVLRGTKPTVSNPRTPVPEPKLNDPSRTSHHTAKSPPASCARALTRASPRPRRTRRSSPTCRRNPPAASNPSSSYPLLPVPSSACRTSNPSSTQASSSRPTPLTPLPPTCSNSTASSPPSTPLQQCASFSSTQPRTSNRHTGRA
jgi:parafibromin